MSEWMTISERVRGALAEDKPVVALESTLVAHGLPWPENLETAREMEEAIRREGAEPATIALLGGRARIGLEPSQLETVARDGGVKATTRDLPALMAEGCNAATTVASTLFLASRAGIAAMATGGIGGVHRDADETGDVSADLGELARTPVLVVCSGAKSILDLPRTLERLETLGVPVIGYKTSEFPGFYTRRTGLALEQRADSPGEAARIAARARELGLPSAVLVVQPVPQSEALAESEVRPWVEEALREAEKRRLSGKRLTPFLLKRLQKASEGRALRANRTLAVANARLAARIAQAGEPHAEPQGAQSSDRG